MTRRTRLRRPPTIPAQAVPVEPAREAAQQDVQLRELAADDGRPVAELLREVAEFRLALETDLTIAAAAAEADAPELAAEVVTGDVEDLRALEDRMIRGLAAAAALADAAPLEVTPAMSRARALRRRPRGSAVRRGMALHTGPVLAAAVAIGVAGGFAIPHLAGGTHQAAGVAADAQFASLSKAVGADDEGDALVAARALHASVGQLIDDAADDPDDARDAARLLLAEGVVLSGVRGPKGTELRSQMQALVQRLQATSGPIRQLVDDPATETTPGPVTVGSSAPASQPLATVAARGTRTTTTSPAPVAPLTRLLPLPVLTVRPPLLLPTRRPTPIDLPHPSLSPSVPALPSGLPLLPTAVVSSPAASEPSAPDVSPSVSPGADDPGGASSPSDTAASTSPGPSPSPVLQLPGNSPSAGDNRSPILGF